MGAKRERKRRGILPKPPGPTDPEKGGRPRMRKLRFAFVVLGLCALAFVSWIFGIMMAVAQDLPSLESREQYRQAAELGRLRLLRQQARHADQQPGPDPARFR